MIARERLEAEDLADVGGDAEVGLAVARGGGAVDDDEAAPLSLIHISKEKVLELLAWHVETGKIDCIVVETMTRDYDAIMLSVAAACQPVAAAYERVQSAYALMLGKLKRWQAENEGRSA